MPRVTSKIGNRNAVATAPILAKAAANPAPLPRIAVGNTSAGEQVGLRIRAQVGHEVEQHEAGEDQYGLKSAADIDRKRSQQQADRAADEADNLQPDPAQLVGQQNGKSNADDQQQ